MTKKVIYILFILMAVCFISQCRNADENSQLQPQNNSSSNNSLIPELSGKVGSNAKIVGQENLIEPKDVGNIDSTFSEMTITNLELETVLNQSAPKMWFVFDCEQYENTPPAECFDGRIQMEFSPELKKLVAENWKASLKIQYKELLKKYINVQELDDDQSAHIAKNMAFVKNVQILTVEAPLGNRKISQTEANEILTLIGKNAQETIQSAQIKFI